MTYDPDWYLRDDHPDAAEHRKFLGIDNKGRPLAVPTPQLTPDRPRRPVVRKALVRKGDGGLIIRKKGDFGGDEVECLLSYVDESLKALAAEISKVREKDRAETQKALDKRLLWRGTWRSGESYAVNDMVQDKSTIWVCLSVETKARPGSGSGWRMLVKTGGAK